MPRTQVSSVEVKKINRNRIFRYLCQGDMVSNPDIAYDLKMSLPTVMQNTKELMEKNLLLEAGELQSTGGRKAKAIVINGNAKVAIGLDITRNHIGLVLTNLLGETLKYKRIHKPFQVAGIYYKGLNLEIGQFIQECDVEEDKILGIGISLPAIIDYEQDMITYSHALALKPLACKEISQYFTYPCYFVNDANAGAYAEGRKNNPVKRVFYFSLSNTIGGAIFDNNELILGNNFRCGEVGHMCIIPEGKECYCGKKGCLDAYCAAYVLDQYGDGKLEVFFEKLKEQDEICMGVWDTYLTHLAIGINNVRMLLDCDIILGGYVGSYLEDFIEEIRERAARLNTFEESGAYIQACHYQVEAAALGAASQVIELFIETV